MTKILRDSVYETDDERRLHQALNRTLGEALAAVDAATKLRTSPGDAKRKRGQMRESLEVAAHAGMDALSHTLKPDMKPQHLKRSRHNGT